MDDSPPTISPAFAAFSVQVTRSVVVKNNYGVMKIWNANHGYVCKWKLKLGKLIQLPKTVLNICVCALAARGIGESTFLMSSLTKFCLWTNFFVCKTLYALDMPQVTSQVKGGLFINAHTKLYCFIFHKCGDNETIPQHFYRELKGNKSYDHNKYNLRFLPISFTEWTQFVLSFTDLNAND